ncbi:hypothetical protein BDC45DRAFT_539732 [Circinella umbellata]|nr:hypothetical protein BDC45DRAFT_539732 [Circinella umbellata]
MFNDTYLKSNGCLHGRDPFWSSLVPQEKLLLKPMYRLDKWDQLLHPINQAVILALFAPVTGRINYNHLQGTPTVTHLWNHSQKQVRALILISRSSTLNQEEKKEFKAILVVFHISCISSVWPLNTINKANGKLYLVGECVEQCRTNLCIDYVVNLIHSFIISKDCTYHAKLFSFEYGHKDHHTAVGCTKRKTRVGEGKVVDKISIQTEDYIGFLGVVMKVLNPNDMGRRTLEMYNVAIYKMDELQDVISPAHKTFICYIPKKGSFKRHEVCDSAINLRLQLPNDQSWKVFML